MVVAQRVGFVSGRDACGAFRVVSVYRDGTGIKLCGPSGSMLLGDIEGVAAAAANEYRLEDASFFPTTRAA